MHIFCKCRSNSLQLNMILTHSMMVCHTQHLATNSQGQGHNFDSNFGEKSIFSEYDHVAYQIKVKCMATYKRKFHTYKHPGPLWWGQKVKAGFFLKMVMLHIRLKGTMPAIILSLHLGWGQKVKTIFFLKMVLLHIKLKGMKLTIPCQKIFCHYTHPRPLGGVNRSKHFFFYK